MAALKLNTAQHLAATTFEGPILCVAGAGTGKTATLTSRVAFMVEAGIAPESILLLTFTRKSAQEMLTRAMALLDHRCGDVAGGTFHAFAHKVLRKHGDLVGLGDGGMTLIDQEDVEQIIKWQIEDSVLADEAEKMPAASTLRAMFSKCTNWELSLEEVCQKDYFEYRECLPEIQRVRDALEMYKVWNKVIDFDDLLIFCQRLLELKKEIRESLSDRYQYIMVDEYQDTNAMQARIVRLLASVHDNVMAVGDESQSIYAFRGANVRNILEFPQQFPGCQVIPLEENFRSIQPILDTTNAVIHQAKESFRKTLYSQRISGCKPVLAYCEDEHAQSEYVAGRIQALQQAGVALSEIAVLFRSSFHAFDLELELNALKIPYVKVGGLRFLESRHIKDVIAFLRVIVNINDRLAWMRILTMLPGLGPKTAEKMMDRMTDQELPYQWLAECPMRGKYQDDVQKLGQMLQQIYNMPPAGQIEIVMAYYLPYLRDHAEDDKDYLRRQQDLEQLLVMAARYGKLELFLNELALDPPNEVYEEGMELQDDKDLLTLSTIHSAKGLEWKVIFVLWLTEGRFPSLYAYEDQDRLEEELRLLYVAMTRAKDELHLLSPTYYDYRAGMTFAQVSSWLANVPPDVYQTQTVRSSDSSVMVPSNLTGF